MKIDLHEITIKEVYNGYKDNNEDGVVGYGGKLNIRPAYQREFVYKDKQRDEVINTVMQNFPLNVMYWVKAGEDSYEMLDGQQRTISICSYIDGDFSIDYKYFHSLTKDEQNQILNYKLMIYICDGTDKEKLDWFKIINIAGVQFTNQELRNAIYTGEWLSDAKKYFSKNNCPAYNLAGDYLNGSAIRQDYLETVIRWIAKEDGTNNSIEEYMSIHQHNTSANELWLYFTSVINWVKVIYPIYRKEMKGIDWGVYYNQFKKGKYDPKKLESEIVKLLLDDDVTKKTGIYEYLLDGEEKHLSIRAFTPKMKREAYEKQNGICPKCSGPFKIEEMEGDHVIPWHLGGKTTTDNCQMLCKDCNRKKSGK